MKLLIEETELKNLVYKAVRYDIIVDSLIREKFDKIDIYSDWETVESYMDDIMRQQPNNIKPTDELKKKDIYDHLTNDDNTIEFTHY